MTNFESWPTDEWLSALAAGDPDVEQEFWKQYAAPLHRVADRQLSRQLKKRVDPEDIVQSAYRTFFRRVRKGEFELSNQSDLWRLLLTITLNKARMQARYHGRDCRDASREQALAGDVDRPGTSFEEELNQVDLEDFLDSIFQRLDAEQQDILQRTLDNQSPDAIAKALGCSQRTVRRMRARIQEILQSILDDDLQGNQ